MNKKIVYLALDERPCNYIYPQYIAKCGNVDICTAPLSLMGNFKKPADIDGLWAWLFEQLKADEHVVLSTDLMLYGGIVPSRIHHFTDSQCALRIQKLAELKRLHPEATIYAFGLITRAPARNGAGEEPDYYEEHGYDIHRYGIVSDMLSSGVSENEANKEKQGILQRVPQNHLDDFAARRKTNFNSHLKIIDLAASGVIDHLIIPLDDCKEFGWAPAERKLLARYAASKNMLSSIAMYPGADEIGCTLVAKAICHINGFTPKIYLDYTSNTGILTIPTYEDRTIGETAPHHALNGGAVLAATAAESDAIMFVNAPTAFSQRLEKELDRRDIHLECERNLPAFISRVKAAVALNKPCFIADCAIANGADKCLMLFLYEQNMLDKISGYSGWNTSSNSMGTVMAHAIAYSCAMASGQLTPEAIAASNEFKLYRYIEDWGYMVEVRKTLTERLDRFGSGLDFLHLADKEPIVADAATAMLQKFMRNYFPHARFTPRVRMPWNRMFEVSLSLLAND